MALVSMPTMATRFPSFQLALLGPILEQAGVTVRPLSLFLDFAAQIGVRRNDALAEVYPCMAGEWIWSRAAFGDESPADDPADDADYLERYAGSFRAICEAAGTTVDDLRRVRDVETTRFLARVVDEVDWPSFGLVGLTVTFQQMVASLALAKALKRRYPDLPVILGGAAFEDDIAAEIMARNPEVDLLHCGDADVSFPEVVSRLYAGESMAGLRGVLWRDGDTVVAEGRAPNFGDLDANPLPDFDEYFATRARTGVGPATGGSTMLPIETARGCWYGMKNHCVFCGLNRSGMEFRHAGPDRVLAMLKHLSSRYGTRDFNAIDNILAPAYLSRLFRRLADARTDLRLHYEVRPKLTRTQLGELRRGGLVSVQPGIESFSTHVLEIMRKNTTAVRNLELLKWTTYYGIHNAYNVLYGFPGETAADYAAQAEVIRRIPHLQPPYAMALARPDRGSPMFTSPDDHAIAFLRPSGCYRHIYPKDYDLARIAYFFEHGLTVEQPTAGHDACRALVADWKARWADRHRPYLRYVKTWESVSIHDGRGAQRLGYRYDDAAATLYEACADARTADELYAAVPEEREWVDRTLRGFVDRDLMLHVDDRYLALALPENRYH